MLGRDLGKGLTSLSKKLYPIDDTPIQVCAQATNEWMEREISLALANEKEQKAENIRDQGGCLLAVIESSGAKDAGEIRRKLDLLFSSESGRVTLATGHRSKGLEWDVVLHLDPWRIPSKFAKSPSQLEQEYNLGYVIETRSKNVLLFASIADFSTN
jgi:superfamily I DNA/RNA helicase